ncbi:hypothetical protein OR16_01615 [Cupriavidus basilensis OR16]|uniref:Uncharacterized protein n=1 Tax=Cupriavidus basilensis OR16 TaxID=1127483 RepID=H1RYJ1_9BURK|nr:hypothetical protein OR16_01615 [Cupriavidus basilensis OR16]
MQEEVTWRCDGDALAGAVLPERMECRGTWPAEQPVPCTGTEAADAGQLARRHAMTNRTDYRGHVGTPCSDDVGVAVAIGECRHDEYRAACDGAGKSLGFGAIFRHWILYVVYIDTVCGQRKVFLA